MSRKTPAPTRADLLSFDADIDLSPTVGLDYKGNVVIYITLPDGTMLAFRASEIVAKMSPIFYEQAVDRWQDSWAAFNAPVGYYPVG